MTFVNKSRLILVNKCHHNPTALIFPSYWLIRGENTVLIMDVGTPISGDWEDVLSKTPLTLHFDWLQQRCECEPLWFSADLFDRCFYKIFEKWMIFRSTHFQLFTISSNVHCKESQDSSNYQNIFVKNIWRQRKHFAPTSQLIFF